MKRPNREKNAHRITHLGVFLKIQRAQIQWLQIEEGKNHFIEVHDINLSETQLHELPVHRIGCPERYGVNYKKPSTEMGEKKKTENLFSKE